MWLSLYTLVPFEYFRYLHHSVFSCQAYLLLSIVFILLFLTELPHSVSSWQRIQDIINKLSTLSSWRLSEVDLYYTLSSLRSKITLDGCYRISHSVLPEPTTRYTRIIQLSYDHRLLGGQVDKTTHFIASLLYSQRQEACLPSPFYNKLQPTTLDLSGVGLKAQDFKGILKFLFVLSGIIFLKFSSYLK